MLQNGAALREFRELMRWSSSSLAAEMGIAQPTLSNYEAERRSAPAETLERAAELLGISVEAIRRERAEAYTNPTGASDSAPVEAVA